MAAMIICAQSSGTVMQLKASAHLHTRPHYGLFLRQKVPSLTMFSVMYGIESTTIFFQTANIKNAWQLLNDMFTGMMPKITAMSKFGSQLKRDNATLDIDINSPHQSVRAVAFILPWAAYQRPPAAPRRKEHSRSFGRRGTSGMHTYQNNQYR